MPRGGKSHLGKFAEAHPAWKGEDVSIAGAHSRAYRLVRTMDACAHADETCLGKLSRHHDDGNPWNNGLSNIVILCESHHHRLHHRRRPQTGERNPNARLTWEDVRTIRSSTDNDKALASRFGVHPSHIFKIRHNLKWRVKVG